MLERLKTIMLGLWYPAVLGTLIVLFLDHVAAEETPAAKTTTWLALFLILYYTILFEESQHSHIYTFWSWIIDLIDIGIMYLAYLFLGYALGGRYQSPRFFYGVLVLGFLEPIIWRRLEKRQDTLLDLLCYFGVVTMLGGVLFSPESFCCCIVLIVWGLFAIYVGYAIVRVIRGNTQRPNSL